MNNNNANIELPSKSKLLKSTVIAICIAAIILVAVVLPAEYGIDPTGIGAMIGLKKMGEIKVSLAEEAAIEKDVKVDVTPPAENIVAKIESKPAASITETNAKSDKFTVTLAPDEGKEIKVTMTKGSTVNYLWQTDGGVANYDAHADSKKLEIKYHNYEKGKLQRSEGVMEAAFDGNHGWFWRNRTSKTMTVTLEVSGDYTDVVQY